MTLHRLTTGRRQHAGIKPICVICALLNTIQVTLHCLTTGSGKGTGIDGAIQIWFTGQPSPPPAPNPGSGSGQNPNPAESPYVHHTFVIPAGAVTKAHTTVLVPVSVGEVWKVWGSARQCDNGLGFVQYEETWARKGWCSRFNMTSSPAAPNLCLFCALTQRTFQSTPLLPPTHQGAPGGVGELLQVHLSSPQYGLLTTCLQCVEVVRVSDNRHWLCMGREAQVIPGPPAALLLPVTRTPYFKISTFTGKLRASCNINLCLRGRGEGGAGHPWPPAALLLPVTRTPYFKISTFTGKLV